MIKSFTLKIVATAVFTVLLLFASTIEVEARVCPNICPNGAPAYYGGPPLLVALPNLETFVGVVVL